MPKESQVKLATKVRVMLGACPYCAKHLLLQEAEEDQDVSNAQDTPAVQVQVVT